MSPIYPYGPAPARATIKRRAEDFIVDEELGFEPGGDGEHLFLLIEKRGLGTPELLQRIAKVFNLSPASISYSGLKDKHALTTQWFSLHLPGQDVDPGLLVGDDCRVLRAERHHRKLRRGTHRGNRFRLVLRDLEDFSDEALRQLGRIETGGMANYFGYQRFGRAGDNVEQALRQLSRKRVGRQRRGILLSSLRSYLFNQILARRISEGIWEQPLDGDVFMLRGSHSLFSETPDETLLQRYRSFDISSCASLYGDGQSLLQGQALAIEEEVFGAHAEITSCLERQRVKRQMRALRVAPEHLNYEYDAGNSCLRLELALPAGSYVTSLLQHFVEIVDASQDDF